MTIWLFVLYAVALFYLALNKGRIENVKAYRLSIASIFWALFSVPVCAFIKVAVPVDGGGARFVTEGLTPAALWLPTAIGIFYLYAAVVKDASVFPFDSDEPEVATDELAEPPWEAKGREPSTDEVAPSEQDDEITGPLDEAPPEGEALPDGDATPPEGEPSGEERPDDQAGAPRSG